MDQDRPIIITNTLYQLAAKFVSTFSALILSIVITRLLGANTWGEYSVVMAFVSFFYVFTEFGLNGIAAREFSKVKRIDSKNFIGFFVARLLITLLVIAIGVFTLNLFNYPTYLKQAIYLSQIGVLFFSLGSSFNSVFQAKHSYKYLFYITLLGSFINLCILALIVYLKTSNILWLLVPMVVTDVSKFFIAYIFSKKIVSFKSYKVNWVVVKFYFLAALPLGVALIFNTLMTQIDRLMLSAMVPAIELGFYSLSYKLFDIALVVPTFFMNAAFPILVMRYKTKKNYNLEFTQSYYLLFISAIIITLLGIGLSWYLIPAIWGSTMIPSIVSFNILIASTVLFYASSPISWCYVIENKMKYLVYFYFIGFVLNLVSNFFAIKYFGYVGAAFTTLITELVVLILLDTFRKKVLTVKYLPVSIPEIVKFVHSLKTKNA